LDTAKLVAAAPEGDAFALDTFADANVMPAALRKSRLRIIVLPFILTGWMPGNYSRRDAKRNSKVGDVDVNLFSSSTFASWQLRICFSSSQGLLLINEG